MAQVTRSSLILPFQELCGVQAGVDKVPTELSNNIQPSIMLNQRNSIVHKVGTNGLTASVTVYTTPSDKDFFLTYLNVAFTKDNACTAASVAIVGVIGGLAQNILVVPCVAATAEAQSRAVSLAYPLKLDKNSAITLVGSFGAGAMNKYAVISGYILE